MTARPQPDVSTEVPADPGLRREIWRAAVAVAADLPRARPLGREQLQAAGRSALEAAGAAAEHAGYAMVMVNNAFWREQFASVPFDRRLLLLPRCLVNLAEVRARAEALGYRIHVLEGTPSAVRLIAEANMGALVGIGCLDSLGRSFDKVRQLGVPALAVPLNRDGCNATEIDTDWALELLATEGPAVARTRSYLPLLRTAHGLFADGEFRELLGRSDTAAGDGDATARIALDWLMSSGKRLRPLVTLASYRAMAPGGELPVAVRRAALAVEAFHKASLIHDDIEDDDDLRYGRATVHRAYGVPVAINVGDYLVGLGYSLASRCAPEPGGSAPAALPRIFADAHLRLARGQGAELLWQRQGMRALSVAEALAMAALKTAPAFESAMAAGLELAGALAGRTGLVADFSHHVGSAFQIDNDLAGWEGDASHVRPTVLLALALERCDAGDRTILFRPGAAGEVRAAFDRLGVFDRARGLREDFRNRALAEADRAPECLGEVFRFLVETALK